MTSRRKVKAKVAAKVAAAAHCQATAKEAAAAAAAAAALIVQAWNMTYSESVAIPWQHWSHGFLAVVDRRHSSFHPAKGGVHTIFTVRAAGMIVRDYIYIYVSTREVQAQGGGGHQAQGGAA